MVGRNHSDMLAWPLEAPAPPACTLAAPDSWGRRRPLPWLETKPGISSSCCPSLCGWGTPPWSEGRIQPCPSGIYFDIWCKRGFLGDSVVKILPANAGDLGSIPGLGRSPGEGTSNPLQYSCLGNPMDRGAWWAVVHGVTRVGHN